MKYNNETKPLLKLQPKNIPAELKSRAQWVLWRAEVRDNRSSKVPYCATTGKTARVNDPTTWSKFDTALNAYKKDKQFDGIGYVLTADDPYVGIDLDNCANVVTRNIDTHAQEILKRIDSYAEISPSGTGVRIFAIAKLPAGKRKKGNIEVYDQNRFLTLTGHHITDTPKVIADSNVSLRIWYKKFFNFRSEMKQIRQPKLGVLPEDLRLKLDEAFTSKHGKKIKKLFDGDTSGYPSPSEADQALCNHLAFWLDRDPAKIDRAFRCSFLFRDKWDENRYGDGTTYGQMTIRKAVKLTTDAHRPATNQRNQHTNSSKEGIITTISLKDLAKKDFGEVKSIIDNGILPKGGCLIIAGESGVGKSLITIEWSIMLAAGLNLYEDHLLIPQPRSSIIFQSENIPRFVQQRLRMMIKGIPLNSAPNNIFMNEEQILGFDINDDQCFEKIIAAVNQRGAEVIFIDPLQSFHHVNENDNVAMRGVLDRFSRVGRETSAAVIIVHHFTKHNEKRGAEYRLRGATSIRDWTDTLITLERQNNEGKQLLSLNFSKVRYGSERRPITLERDPYTLLHNVSEDSGLKVSAEDVFQILYSKFSGKVDKKKMLIDAIMDEFECSDRTAMYAIKHAVEQNLVGEKQDGRTKTIYILKHET
jgi:hypothetical protein